MDKITIPNKLEMKILSLGAESAGRFCFYNNGDVFMSPYFGDILDYNNFKNYHKAILKYTKSNKPDLILTDLHPVYNSTVLGEELSKKMKVQHLKVQHHLAHIFSSIGDRLLQTVSYELPAIFYGIAMDGTGYGFDGNIWGGEVFKITNNGLQISGEPPKTINEKDNLMIERIGSLEEQTMIGGDLAVEEPARMLIAITAKITNRGSAVANKHSEKTEAIQYIYSHVKDFYSRNELELLYNQLEQNFNCQITTSAGRIFDAVSVLLAFSGNERHFKHEAAKLLEKKSSVAYDNCDLQFTSYHSRTVLSTTHLFEYLLKNIRKDKKRLAATAQLYIAKGLYKIIQTDQGAKFHAPDIYFAGGMADNSIISSYMENRNIYLSKKIPRGDEGIAFGQIIYYLLNK